MGTFGNTSSVGSSSGRADGLLSKFTVPEACTVTDISLYIKDVRSATSENVAIYDHDSVNDLPGNLLAQGTPIAVTTADNATWITFTGFSVSLTSGQTVWLGGRGNAKTGMLWATGTKIVNTSGSDTTTWADPFDNGGSSWALDLAIYATYTPAGGTVYTENLSSNIIGIESITDSQAYKENYLSITSISNITETDAKKYAESLVNVILSNISISDQKKYIENISTSILSTISESDAILYKEILQDAISSVSTLTDIQTYKNNLISTITSIITSSNLQGYKESIINVISSITTISDSKAFQENLLNTIVSTISRTDQQTYIELLNSLAIAIISETDTTGGALIEALSLTIGSFSNITDLQKFLDSINFTMTSLISEIDGRRFIENPQIAALIGITDSDLQNYVELQNLYEIEVPSKDSAYYFNAIKDIDTKFLLYVPENITTNKQIVLDITYNAGLDAILDIPAYIKGKTFTFGSNSVDCIQGMWNHIHIQTSGLITLHLSVNHSIPTTEILSIPSITNIFFLAESNYPSGYNNYFGDPGYKVSNFTGNLSFGKTWQDSAKTIPANIGDPIQVFDSSFDDLSAFSTNAIKRSFSQYFNSQITLTDKQNYYESLNELIFSIISSNEIQKYLDSLNISIISQTIIQEILVKLENLSLIVNSNILTSNNQNYFEQVLTNIFSSINEQDNISYIERLLTNINTVISENDFKKYLNNLIITLITITTHKDVYTPNIIPEARFKLYKHLLTDFKKLGKNLEFYKKLLTSFEYKKSNSNIKYN